MSDEPKDQPDGQDVLRGLVREARQFPEIRILVGLGGLTLGISLFFVELVRWTPIEAGTLQKISLSLVGLAVLAMVFSVVRRALNLSFRPESKQRLLTTILVSYAVLAVTFTALYYSLAVAGDWEDSRYSYRFYEAERQRLEAGEIDAPALRTKTRRALGGYFNRSWLGVEEFVVEETGREVAHPPEVYVDVTRRKSIEEVVRFDTRTRFVTFVDCAHLAVATMTTLGYGDIYPLSWMARLSAIIHVMSSTFLLGVGLSLVLGDFWERSHKGK